MQSNARYSIDKELTQLLQQDRLEDAFTLALSLGSSSVTSWICKQVSLVYFTHCAAQLFYVNMVQYSN